MRVYLTRGPAPEHEQTDRERTQLANDLSADLFISLHIDRHPNPAAQGVPTCCPDCDLIYRAQHGIEIRIARSC